MRQRELSYSPALGDRRNRRKWRIAFALFDSLRSNGISGWLTYFGLLLFFGGRLMFILLRSFGVLYLLVIFSGGR